MHQNIDDLTERFEKSLFVLSKTLGPELIRRTQTDLTPSQVFMLHFIRQENQCNVSKLAEKMEVAPSAITVMLDRLENHGFVNRVRDKGDRRVVIAELTTAGEERLNQVVGVQKQIEQYCLAQLDVNELESFVHTLESLASIARMMEPQEVIGSKWIGLSNTEDK